MLRMKGAPEVPGLPANPLPVETPGDTPRFPAPVVLLLKIIH